MDEISDEALLRWQDYLSFCNERARANYWFRGVTNSDHKLVPKIGRPHMAWQHGWDETVSVNKRQVNLHNREKRLLNAFERRALLDLKFLPKGKLEWLALAQHHGVPTRLLDWTTNRLMAAWFAVSGSPESPNQEACIFALSVPSTRHVHQDEIDPFREAPDVSFVVAPHWHPRVRAQRGCFSVHAQPHKAYRPKASEFRIHQKLWPEFKRRLYYFGIDASTVMGDLGGLGQALAWQYETEVGIGQVGY